MLLSRTLRTGLIVAALLGLADIVAAIAGGGETPPTVIAIPLAALGVLTLVAIWYGWRGSRTGIAVAAVARTLSALAAVPGFFAGGLPLAVAAVVVGTTAVALALVAKGWSTATGAARHTTT